MVALSSLKQNIEIDVDGEFQKFIQNGEPPFDYERSLVRQHCARVKTILNGENPPPYELEIQPSPFCNAKCTHCWARSFKRLENRLSTKQAIDRIISQVLGFERNGFKIDNVKFCGSTGEPLMNSLILYMIEQFYGKRPIILFTNGIKIGENLRKEEYLKALSKVNTLILSLDAGTTETLWHIKPGAKACSVRLEQILEGAEKIKKKASQNIRLQVGYVITNENYHEIVNATQKAKEYEADLIRFRIDMTDRKVSENHGTEITDLLDCAKQFQDATFKVIPVHSESEIGSTKQEDFGISKKDRCYTCKLWTCIGSNGDIYPCGHVVIKGDRNYGNILEENFSEIWDSDLRQDLIRDLPIKACKICSPASLRRNKFMTFLSEVPREKVSELIERTT